MSVRASGGRRSLVFPPAPESPIPTIPAGGDLQVEWEAPAPAAAAEPFLEDILLLGAMLHDADCALELLKRLPRTGAKNYRGDLRVILSMSKHLAASALRLLGEDPDA